MVVNRVGFKVDGLSGVVRGLRAMGAEVEDPAGLTKLAEDGARLTEAEVPRLTGRLAGDVRSERTKGRAAVVVGSSLPYAGVINWGWPKRNIAAAGYVRRVDQQLEPLSLRRLEEDINRAINREGLA